MLGHQTLQLLPDILGLLEGADLEEVVVCPPADSQRHVSISEVQMRGCRSMMFTGQIDLGTRAKMGIIL